MRQEHEGDYSVLLYLNTRLWTSMQKMPSTKKVLDNGLGNAKYAYGALYVRTLRFLWNWHQMVNKWPHHEI